MSTAEKKEEQLTPIWILNKYGDIFLELLNEKELENFDGSNTPGREYSGVIHWWEEDDVPDALKSMRRPSYKGGNTHSVIAHTSGDPDGMWVLKDGTEKPKALVYYVNDELEIWCGMMTPQEFDELQEQQLSPHGPRLIFEPGQVPVVPDAPEEFEE